MKTAMQELIDWVGQYEGKMISADQVILKAYKLLEKEKEQIVEFADRYADDVMGGCVLRAEEYYNQTYNQNN